MPASARYGAATRRLVEELRARGYAVGCRAVEQWAAWGLAPAPVRVSLGRRGSTSHYPAAAIEQYAAVASVMRRGQDWRTAGLLLISRGHRVVKETTFRLLLDYLFTLDVEVNDPLQFADEQVAEAKGHPLFKRMARIARSNIAAAKITDPVTGIQIDAEAAAPAVMVRGLATMLGEPMPRDAAEETAAAWGMIDTGMPRDVREHRIDVVCAAAERVLNFERLSAAAQTVDPARLQAAVLELRRTAAEHPLDAWELLPLVWKDMLIITGALANIVIEDLGGAAWFEEVSPGLADAETWYVASMNQQAT